MFGIFEGPSKDEKAQYSNLTSQGGFATNLGEGDLTASSTFMQNILSGDPTKIASSLAPEISTAQNLAQQSKNTTTQFGTRSGGTAASTAATDAKTRGDIISLVGGERNGAAKELSSVGTNLLDTGIKTTQTAFGDATQIQKQKASMIDDLISSIAATAGAVAGMPGVGKGAAQGLDSFAGAYGG